MVMRAAGKPRSVGNGKPGRPRKGERAQFTTRVPVDLHDFLVKGQEAGGYAEFNDYVTAFLEAARRAGVEAPSVPQPDQLPLSA
jgi:hypothetical protein